MKFEQIQEQITSRIIQLNLKRPSIKRKRKKYDTLQQSRYDYSMPVPSILCPNCIGGIIYHSLGLQFMSPTINMWMTTNDFVKFVSNLDDYLKYELEWLKDYPIYHPVAKLNDITLFLNHYSTFDEACEKWNERKKRIDFNNLYIITGDTGLSDEDINKINSVKTKKTIIFTATDRSHLKNTCLVKRYQKKGIVGLYSNFDLDGLRVFEKFFDYVDWLNS